MRPKISDELAARLYTWCIERKEKLPGDSNFGVTFEQALDLLLKEVGF